MSRQSLDMAYGRQGGRVVPWNRQPEPDDEAKPFRREWWYPRTHAEQAHEHADAVGGYVTAATEWTLFVITHDPNAVWPSTEP